MSGTDTPTHVYWDLENRKGLWARGEAMSETPQAILATWLEAGSPTHLPRIREAIRAVLEENEGYKSYEPCPKCGCGVTASCYGCRLKQAEAERDAAIRAVQAGVR